MQLNIGNVNLVQSRLKCQNSPNPKTKQWENNTSLNALEINQSQAKQNRKLKKLEVIDHHTKDPLKVLQDIFKESPKMVIEKVSLDHQWGLKWGY